MTERAVGWLARRGGLPVAAICSAVLLALELVAPARSLGQGTLYSVGTCVEYDNQVIFDVIAHYGYLSTESSSVTIPLSSSNYFTPITTPLYLTFAPGYHADVLRTPLIPGIVSETWHLEAITAQVNSIESFYQTEIHPTPTFISPACDPVFVAGAPTFASTGTYPNQLLAQINSGPPADPSVSFAVTGLVAPGSNLTVSNLHYVPDDSASSALNPNSIYGDVTVTGSVTGASTPVLLQLTVGGVVVISGAVSITH